MNISPKDHQKTFQNRKARFIRLNISKGEHYVSVIIVFQKGLFRGGYLWG